MQASRWYGLGAASLANFRGMNGDILAISLSDDPFGTPAAIHRLLEYFSRAQRFHLRITPQSAGVRKIGHFAFFHDRFRDSLWNGSLACRPEMSSAGRQYPTDVRQPPKPCRRRAGPG